MGGIVPEGETAEDFDSVDNMASPVKEAGKSEDAQYDLGASGGMSIGSKARKGKRSADGDDNASHVSGASKNKRASTRASKRAAESEEENPPTRVHVGRTRKQNVETDDELSVKSSATSATRRSARSRVKKEEKGLEESESVSTRRRRSARKK